MQDVAILHPEVRALLARVRLADTLVIADRGFPYWPKVQTIDLSLVDEIPKVADVLGALRYTLRIGRIWMAEEFQDNNSAARRKPLENALAPFPLLREPHIELKQRVPSAICLIRTGDTLQYSNLVIEVA